MEMYILTKLEIATKSYIAKLATPTIKNMQLLQHPQSLMSSLEHLVLDYCLNFQKQIKRTSD